MGARFRSWWQQIKQHRVAIEVVGIVLVVVITLIIAGYWFDWTGFNGYNKVTIAHTISGANAGAVTRTEEYQPGKTLWDWLQLLIIPLVLAVAALLFNFANSRTQQKIAKERYEQDQQIAVDKQRQDLLQSYLDRMSELLLKEKLRSAEVDAEVRNVARVRTITVLTQLDARRIGYVFAFLREARLISTTSTDNVVSLGGADLHAVNWNRANLSGANLSGAILSNADLNYANLIKSDLNYADLSRANLSNADLIQANLSNADLMEADLMEADLNYADLSRANLSDANLQGANLSNALLIQADLNYTDLSRANLSNANLSNADLKGAIGVTIEELEKQAKSLKGATMPDGSKHS